MDSSSQAVADTRRWLERAVIGLNLCPFAKAVLVKDQVHFAATEADDAAIRRSTPAATAASTTLNVPVASTSMASRGSSAH